MEGIIFLCYFVGFTALAMAVPAGCIFFMMVCRYAREYGSLTEDKMPEALDLSMLGPSRRELERRTAYLLKMEKKRRRCRSQYRRIG